MRGQITGSGLQGPIEDCRRRRGTSKGTGEGAAWGEDGGEDRSGWRASEAAGRTPGHRDRLFSALLDTNVTAMLTWPTPYLPPPPAQASCPAMAPRGHQAGARAGGVGLGVRPDTTQAPPPCRSLGCHPGSHLRTLGARRPGQRRHGDIEAQAHWTPPGDREGKERRGGTSGHFLKEQEARRQEGAWRLFPGQTQQRERQLLPPHPIYLRDQGAGVPRDGVQSWQESDGPTHGGGAAGTSRPKRRALRRILCILGVTPVAPFLSSERLRHIFVIPESGPLLCGLDRWTDGVAQTFRGGEGSPLPS